MTDPVASILERIAVVSALRQTRAGNATFGTPVRPRPGHKLPKGGFRATKALRKRLRRECARAGAIRSAAFHKQTIFYDRGRFFHTRPGEEVPLGCVAIHTPAQFDQVPKMAARVPELLPLILKRNAGLPTPRWFRRVMKEGSAMNTQQQEVARKIAENERRYDRRIAFLIRSEQEYKAATGSARVRLFEEWQAAEAEGAPWYHEAKYRLLREWETVRPTDDDREHTGTP